MALIDGYYKHEFAPLFFAKIKKEIAYAKARTVYFINIGQYEIRYYMENDYSFQQITIYKMETLVSEVVIQTKDNEVNDYICMAYDVIQSFIKLIAISKSTEKEVIESAKQYGYEE